MIKTIKEWQKIIFTLLLLILLSSCSNSVKYDFNKESQLLTVNSYTHVSKESSGSFIICVGSYRSNDIISTMVVFQAENKQGEYCLFKCLPEKVRFVFDDNLQTPTVEFVLISVPNGDYSVRDINKILQDEYGDSYIIIKCKHSQIPPSYNFNLINNR